MDQGDSLCRTELRKPQAPSRKLCHHAIQFVVSISWPRTRRVQDKVSSARVIRDEVANRLARVEREFTDVYVSRFDLGNHKKHLMFEEH